MMEMDKWDLLQESMARLDRELREMESVEQDLLDRFANCRQLVNSLREGTPSEHLERKLSLDIAEITRKPISVEHWGNNNSLDEISDTANISLLENSAEKIGTAQKSLVNVQSNFVVNHQHVENEQNHNEAPIHNRQIVNSDSLENTNMQIKENTEMAEKRSASSVMKMTLENISSRLVRENDGQQKIHKNRPNLTLCIKERNHSIVTNSPLTETRGEFIERAKSETSSQATPVAEVPDTPFSVRLAKTPDSFDKAFTFVLPETSLGDRLSALSPSSDRTFTFPTSDKKHNAHSIKKSVSTICNFVEASNRVDVGLDSDCLSLISECSDAECYKQRWHQSDTRNTAGTQTEVEAQPPPRPPPRASRQRTDPLCRPNSQHFTSSNSNKNLSQQPNLMYRSSVPFNGYYHPDQGYNFPNIINGTLPSPQYHFLHLGLKTTEINHPPAIPPRSYKTAEASSTQSGLAQIPYELQTRLPADLKPEPYYLFNDPHVSSAVNYGQNAVSKTARPQMQSPWISQAVQESIPVSSPLVKVRHGNKKSHNYLNTGPVPDAKDSRNTPKGAHIFSGLITQNNPCFSLTVGQHLATYNNNENSIIAVSQHSVNNSLTNIPLAESAKFPQASSDSSTDPLKRNTLQRSSTKKQIRETWQRVKKSLVRTTSLKTSSKNNLK